MSGTNAELIAEAHAFVGEYHWNTNGPVKRLADALEAAQRDRALAIAHDTQPYPTAWAYEQACRVRDEARAERDAALAVIGELVADLDAELAGLMTYAMNDLQTRLRAIIGSAK